LLDKGVAMRAQLSSTGHFLRHLYCQWDTLNVPRMAASLTYYTTVALAPLMVVFLAGVGLAFGSAEAQERLIEAVRLEIGDTGASVIQALIARVSGPRLGALATVLAAIAVFFGATGAFSDLRGSLKVIWNVPETGEGGLSKVLLERLISFALVLCTGAMIVISISVSASLAALHRYFPNWVPSRGSHLTEMALSFIVTTVLFAIIYRVVPPERMPWRHIVFGATVTAILFAVGKAAISTYIGTVGVGSPFGAAGSLFAFLIWVYYSSQVFFIGAIITRSRTRAERIGEARKREGELTPVHSSV
jgi:membrane protein